MEAYIRVLVPAIDVVQQRRRERAQLRVTQLAHELHDERVVLLACAVADTLRSRPSRAFMCDFR